MSAAEFRDDVEVEERPTPEPLGLAPDAVEVRRNAGLAAFVGAVASGVAIAYLARATHTGAPLDWVLAAVMGVLGIAHLAAATPGAVSPGARWPGSSTSRGAVPCATVAWSWWSGTRPA
jgi:hypothetical protein